LLIACGVALPVAGAETKAETKPAGSFQWQAWAFDRGNAEVFANPDIYADYRDKHPELVAGDGGELPWSIEYDIDFPVDATYTLHVRYGSPEPRPVVVWLDDRRVGTCLGRATGNAPPFLDRHPRHDRPRHAKGFHGVEWEEACELPATAGKHTLRFTRKGRPPRLSALRIESPVAFPKDWRFAPPAVRVDRIPPAWRRAFLPPDAVNPATLRPAIEGMTADFGSRYPNGERYLSRLAELEHQRRAADDGAPEQKEEVEKALHALQQEAVLAHPALDFDKLLFFTQIDRGVSIYTGHLSRDNPGGNLCVLSPVSPDGEVTELVPELDGVFGRYDLSFDATRVVFCHAKKSGRYRIYEIDIDPATGRRASDELRQLTFESAGEAKDVLRYGGTSYGRGYDDMDPCYLPGGKIMFATTRAERAVLCAPVTATTLHVMDADGRNMRCISSGQVNELAPCLLDDGRVGYTRWEYVDKGFGNVQSLWAVRPDGSGSDHLYKNNVVRPASMINVRSIPNSRMFVTIGVGHHGGLAGPVILVDNRIDRRHPRRMTNITPEISYPGMYPMTRGVGYFREPYPFSEKFFLISHNPASEAKPARFGLYALDRWGNRAELYCHPELSSFPPIPLRPRRKPTEIPPVAAEKPLAETDAAPERPRQALATLFLQDVYQGLTGIERGRVKFVRVMEAMNLSWHDAWRSGQQGDGAGMQASAVSFGADVAIKKIHGVVKVHEDGSALFRVPAEKNLFFQALDENYMELQRMRTFVNLMPGERRSCIGCHEVRRNAPKLSRARPQALDHPAQTLAPQPGDSGPRTVHYARDVQPIFDAYCAGCHGGAEPAAELDLADVLTEKFSQSYESLAKRQLVSYLEGGFGSANVPAELPLTFGSHRSPLVERLRTEPCKSDLTREEFIRIVTWIDANAPYYGTHEGKKNLRWKDEPDFRPLPSSTE